MSDPSDIIRICTIDIGVITFTIYIEDTSLSVLQKLRDRYRLLPKQLQRRTKGPMCPPLKKIFEEMYISGQRRFLEVTDIRSEKMKYEGKKGNGPLDVQTRVNLAVYLESIKDVFEDVDIIRIEQQYVSMGGRKKQAAANMNAIKLGEDVFFWLATNFPEKDLDYFGARFKSEVLGSPEKLSKPQRKKWSVVKATEIFEMRGDTEILDFFTECTRRRRKGEETPRQKLDDPCDTVCMCQALKYRKYIAMF